MFTDLLGRSVYTRRRSCRGASLLWDLWRTTEANVEKVTSSDEIYDQVASAQRRVNTTTPPLLLPDLQRTGGILIVTIVRRISGFRPFSTHRSENNCFSGHPRGQRG